MDDFGHHVYDGKGWQCPYDALDAAIEKKDLSPNIQFVFPAADGIDWTQEPEETLEQLYRRRARELRVRYDHLILMYSGGSDSHQVLMTCLEAGVHLDEVCTFFPMKWVDKVTPTSRRTSPIGLLYEYQQAVVPGLRELALRSPRTKISVVDTTSAYDGDMTEWLDVLPIQHRMSGGTHGLFVANFRAAIQRNLREIVPTPTTAVIYGVDKPHMILDGDDLFVSFPDHWRMGVSNLWSGNGFTPVMFYWGDPQITCKQAHVIKQALELHDRGMISDVDAHRRLIYPRWTFPYQTKEGLHGSLLSIATDGRADAIAIERARYYNDRYAALKLSMADDGERTKRGLRFLFARETKRYLVGQLSRE